MSSHSSTIFVPKEKQVKIGSHKAFLFVGDDGKEQKVFLEFGLNYTPVLHDLAVGLCGVSLDQCYKMSRGDLVQMLAGRVKII